MCCDGNEQYKSFTQHASAAKFKKINGLQVDQDNFTTPMQQQ